MFCVELEKDDAEVHWFKDGLKLREAHHTILKSFGRTHILVFVNVAYQDSGVVTFVTGRSKTSSRLKVKGGLWFLQLVLYKKKINKKNKLWAMIHGTSMGHQYS